MRVERRLLRTKVSDPLAPQPVCVFRGEDSRGMARYFRLIPKYLGPNAQKSRGISIRKRQVIASEMYERISSHSGGSSSIGVAGLDEHGAGDRKAWFVNESEVPSWAMGTHTIREVGKDKCRVECYLVLLRKVETLQWSSRG